MTYVDWFNQRRLHGEITSDATYTIPAKAETKYLQSNTTSRRGCHPITRAVIKPGAFRMASSIMSWTALILPLLGWSAIRFQV